MNSQDSVYDHSKPRGIVQDDPQEKSIRYDYKGPFGSQMEALMSQALNSVTMPGEVLGQVVRPNLPQINPFPPRFGYRSRALGLMDVLNVDHQTPGVRIDTDGGAEGTLRNAQGQGFW
jgi:hypothetical protein